MTQKPPKLPISPEFLLERGPSKPIFGNQKRPDGERKNVSYRISTDTDPDNYVLFSPGEVEDEEMIKMVMMVAFNNLTKETPVATGDIPKENK